MTVADETIPIEVSELAEKYGLPGDVTRAVIERAVSAVLTTRFHCEVEGTFNGDGSFAVWTFHEIAGEMIVDRLLAIPQDSRNAVKKAIELALHERSTLGDYEMIGSMANTLVYGEIVKFGCTGDLIVEIESDWRENIIGTCSTRHQPPLERGGYMLGEHLPFYVLKVRAIRDEDGIPRLEIPLSRTSKRLVECLLKEEVGNSTVKIKCVRRIVGGFSHVLTNAPLPREAIKRVSVRLMERIKVQWGRSF